MIHRYYIDFPALSDISDDDYSVTVWTNVFGVTRELDLDHYDVQVVYRDEEKIVLDVVLSSPNELPGLQQMLVDCVRVENMLDGIEVAI